MDMTYIKVFHNDTVKEYHFHKLLDGLHWLKTTNAVFDYIIIDEETTVHFDEFNAYYNQVNEFCRKVYGTYYEE